MKQHRQPNRNSSSSRLATVLLLTIALPYLLFSGCSADESPSLIIDRRATGLKEKQLQRRLKKLDQNQNQKRIRQSTLSTLLEVEADAPVTDGFAIAAASAGAKSSKAGTIEPRAAPVPPTFPPTVSVQPSSKPSLTPTVSAQPSSKPSLSPSVSSQPSSKPSLSPSVSTQPSSKPSLTPTVSAQPSSKPSLSPSVSAQPSSKPSLSPSVSAQPSFSPSKSGKSSPRYA